MKLWRTVYFYDTMEEKVVLGDEYAQSTMEDTILACTESREHAETLAESGYWHIVEVYV